VVAIKNQATNQQDTMIAQRTAKIQPRINNAKLPTVLVREMLEAREDLSTVRPRPAILYEPALCPDRPPARQAPLSG